MARTINTQHAIPTSRNGPFGNQSFGKEVLLIKETAHRGRQDQTKTKGWVLGSTNGLGGRHKSKEHGHLVGKETTTVGKMEGEPEGKALS